MAEIELSLSPTNDRGEIQIIEEINQCSCVIRMDACTQGVCSVVNLPDGDVSLSVRVEDDGERTVTVALVPLLAWFFAEDPANSDVPLSLSDVTNITRSLPVSGDTYMLIIERDAVREGNEKQSEFDDSLDVYVEFDYAPEKQRV